MKLSEGISLLLANSASRILFSYPSRTAATHPNNRYSVSMVQSYNLDLIDFLAYANRLVETGLIMHLLHSRISLLLGFAAEVI